MIGDVILPTSLVLLQLAMILILIAVLCYSCEGVQRQTKLRFV